ncbi:MAG TPA: PadR family transcriptional regulator [Clostridiales bacterium]|nr:PadR family transcriptional regulator [Clostridiales bacterium]
MRELKYAILGLVNRSPRTGYDITKAFTESIGNFWEAKHSQIYPELHRLASGGLIEYEIEIQGEKLEKKVYSITDKGRNELLNWLLTDEPLPPVPKDSFRLRLYFSENLSTLAVSELINGQLAKRRRRLEHLKEELHAMEDSGEPPVLFTPEFYEYLLIMGGIFREQAYINWINEVKRLTKCEETKS